MTHLFHKHGGNICVIGICDAKYTSRNTSNQNKQENLGDLVLASSVTCYRIFNRQQLNEIQIYLLSTGSPHSQKHSQCCFCFSRFASLSYHLFLLYFPNTQTMSVVGSWLSSQNRLTVHLLQLHPLVLVTLVLVLFLPQSSVCCINPISSLSVSSTKDQNLTQRMGRLQG